MSGNSIGKIFKVTTFGESHGKAIGAVIDGIPPNIDLSIKDIEPFMAKRRPGSSEFTTKRDESDAVEILSGVFEGKTTGSPISLLIFNNDKKSGDYEEIKDKFRPNHGDFSYYSKYGIRDYKGGGRSSARETAARVAAGAVAFKVLQKITPKLKIKAGIIGIGELKTDKFNYNEIDKNPFFCADKKLAEKLEGYLENIIKSGDSVGATVELRAKNMPLGLGEPVFDKLNARLAYALMGVNAVKAVEIGEGIKSASSKGSEFADELTSLNPLTYAKNNCGGIAGGISNGNDLILRAYLKPTPSISQKLNTVDLKGNPCEIITKGRHDPCVGIRAVPVIEAMTAITLLDLYLINKAINNG